MQYIGFKKVLLTLGATFVVILLYRPFSTWGLERTIIDDLAYALGVIINPFMWIVFLSIDTFYKRVYDKNT